MYVWLRAGKLKPWCQVSVGPPHALPFFNAGHALANQPTTSLTPNPGPAPTLNPTHALQAHLLASSTKGRGAEGGKVGKRVLAWYSPPTLIQGGMQQYASLLMGVMMGRQEVYV